MYRVMVRIRTFEDRVFKEFAAGNIPGFVHLYAGEEAIAAGACANLRPDDYITSTHRGHGHLIAKGGKTDRMMAELYGKKTGYNRGKGGSMHIAEVDIGILGADAIVAAGIPIAGGAALSAQMRGTDQVTLCFFGDGATNTTRFHEGVNLASIWKLPIVYVIENNVYAETTPVSYAMNIPNIADRAVAYGIPGKTVDGNDVLAVHEVVGEALARARKGEGPTLVECKTCRYYGHYEGDTQTYRTKQEFEECRKRDPIPRFRKKLIKMGVLTEKDADKINQEMLEELDKAVKFAEESPFPEPRETLEDVYT
ncbi:MAG: thiamine pyrophosphate-dependent dehydrogenase E1 component subunit alpha [Dehalococcoidia bacterium]|nr:MAG: thiamine pyrophosphate-dependent dehydrogenase E1 component subunit alpha [Dehalococcoidia bacterium]